MNARKLLLILVALYAVAFAYMLNRNLNLEFNGELIALLPSDNQHLSTYRELGRLNYSEGGFDALISTSNGERVIGPAREVTRDILKLTSSDGDTLFKNAELENDLYDIKKSVLYLMTRRELDSTYAELKSHIRREKMKANPYYVDLSEEGERGEISISTESSVLLDQLVKSKRYQINSDSTVIRISFIPGFSKSDYTRIEETYQKLLQETIELERQHPGLEISWGGSYIDHYNKINDIQYSVLKALIIGTLSLIVFLVGYMFYINRGTGYSFRYIIADLFLAFTTLVTGFVISLGLSSFLFTEINVFTGIIFSILFGINLDYILHVYSVNKRRGINLSMKGIGEIVRSYLASTRPIILSSLTTGLAIVTLVFAEFEGFKQFGLIFFVNMIVNLLATYLFLLFSPSVDGSGTDEREQEYAESQVMGVYQKIPLGLRRGVLGVLLVILGGTAYLGFQSIQFNYSFSDLEPQTEQSRFDRLEEDLSTGQGYHEPSYFITESLADSRRLFHYLRDNLDDKFTDIERVESFSARYPYNDSLLREKSERVDSLKQLVDRNRELLTPENESGENLLELVENSVSPRESDLPKYITNRFFFRDNSIAPMVIIYPKMSLSNGQTSIQFRKSSGTVELGEEKVYHAASTSIIASSILEILIRESRFLFITPLVTIFGVLLLYYRSVRDTLMATAPLLVCFLLLLSMESLFSFEINLYNVIVLPIIIGVGADNGIHLVDSLRNHRERFLAHFWHHKLPVLSACSVTTVLGFVGMLFIDHPGMESLGLLAVVSIGTILFATVLTSILAESFLVRSSTSEY
ncbi:MAG: hypothetical protein R3281_13445 [Balneolaceae bacterium]|nr:hypothetical protein [Balneolaceae bacterium]